MNSSHPQDDTLSLLKAGKLAGIKHLKLNCGLTHFPEEIFTLANTLEILDLTGNQLDSLPDDLSKLHKLRIIFCSSNRFTHLPEVLGKCQNLSMIGFKANKIQTCADSAIPTSNLRWLILTDNALTKLPDTVGNCKNMQKLMLAGNQLSELPESLANCGKLELLRISANRFESLPEWLFALPKLSWLAYAGNPFSDRIEKQSIAQQRIPEINWHQLKIQQLLGEGASGFIYQAKWKDELHRSDFAETNDVAVKMFKAGLTSDGLPRCEIHATALAGNHAHLFGLKGIVADHPNGEIGMVMPLMDKNLTVLAGPPSFETCSRDVYAGHVEFSLETVMGIARAVASTVKHLHAKGMTHGDLYAHNILSCETASKVILSDLGAASFLPPDNVAQSEQLQRIESRAFGCLLEELLSHVVHNHNAQNKDLVQNLWHLQTECAQATVANRPLFDAIEARIQSLRFSKLN